MSFELLMTPQSKTLFEQLLAPVFEYLIDKKSIQQLRNRIDWEPATSAFTNPQVVYPDVL